MASTPDLIVFDVNETLSHMGPLGEAFAREGLAEGSARTWFTGILRDGFAVTPTGGNAAFAETLLKSAGIREHFSELLSVDDAPAWKPARSADDYAAAQYPAYFGRPDLEAADLSSLADRLTAPDS